jgi:vacuolar-type H+-ATPase subunit F/Vma7
MQSGSGAAWVLGDAQTVRAFRLAGLRGRVVSSRAEAGAALAELTASGAALVVVTHALCAALGGPEALAAGAPRPLIAAIPSAATPRGEPSPARQIASVVRRALGIPSERRA